MNRINYNQTGGFPLDNNNLAFLQDALSLMQHFGNMAGNMAIISGCSIAGTMVADGVVFINDEILPFKGGNIGTNVIIIETSENGTFEDGSSKPIEYTRYATFGSSTPDKTFSWSSFYRPLGLKAMEKRLVHPGFIQDYYGSVESIPAGWYLCDGTNGTPDLRGMFVVGYHPEIAEYNEVGKTGGHIKVTPSATIANADLQVTIPITGYGTTGNQPDGNNSISKGRLVAGSGNAELGEALESIRAAGSSQTVSTSHTHTATIEQIDNRPPFYVLVKIMYKG